MAIRFDAAADRLLRTANLPAENGPFTVSFWVRFATVPGAGVYAFAVYVGTDLEANITVAAGSLNATWVLYGTAEASGGTVAANTWYHALITRDTALTPDTTLYIDGVSTLTSDGGASVPTRFEFGAAGTTNLDPFNGRVAAIKWWDVVLTGAEREAEQFNFLPRRFANLQGFHPCIHAVAADNVEDWSGLGRNFTTGGTLTVEDGPPISWGADVDLLPFVAEAEEPPVGLPFQTTLGALRI